MRVWAQRQVVRGFLRKRVILEVNYSPDVNSPLNRYRPATAEDLRQIEESKRLDFQRRNDNSREFPVGLKVRVSQRSGFNRGATGRVVMQEPRGGVVWVKRDGDSGPVWFFADELDFVSRGVTVVV